MELIEGKKYECKRKSNGESICRIYVDSVSWVDTKSDRKVYGYDKDLLDMGIYVFKDFANRTDIFELSFYPNNINPEGIYVKWLCKDFDILEVGEINEREDRN